MILCGIHSGRLHLGPAQELQQTRWYGNTDPVASSHMVLVSCMRRTRALTSEYYSDKISLARISE